MVVFILAYVAGFFPLFLGEENGMPVRAEAVVGWLVSFVFLTCGSFPVKD